VTRARRVLLFASLLLLAAEAVSITLALQRLQDREAERTRSSRFLASALLPRIAEWVRNRGSANSTSEPWLAPFVELSVGRVGTVPPLTQDDGQLAVITEPADRVLTVWGEVETPRGKEVFHLRTATDDSTRFFTDTLLLAQHAFILVAALSALFLAGMAREPESGGESAIGAYEEAMLRLRQRDHDRVRAFEAEKALLTSTLRDREAMARAGDLTAGIVHEVRNSLGTIAIQAKTAQQAGDDRVRAAGAAIADEVQSIQNVMNRFVSFIRTEDVRVAAFDLDRMVRRVAARERARCAASIEVSGESAIVEGDEDLLEVAVENLVRNACQAVEAPGVVRIHSGVLGGEARVVVDDDGPGIVDPQKALRPFESGRAGGLGLGLPLVLKILSLHQGTLDLERRAGVPGTAASCRWPNRAGTATISNEVDKDRGPRAAS
jgi:signal transduction histidine kinase